MSSDTPVVSDSLLPLHRSIMNAFLRIALILLPAALFPKPIRATVVGTGLVHQPVYLGTASQPDRIPLAPVICNSNHGYGSNCAIFEPRPCYHGHFLDQGVPAYEQNLAPLFGIRAEFSDTTQLPGSTLTLHLRNCAPPAHAPYTQEQVVAASLQCLLARASGLRKDSPLTVVIKGDGIPTPDWSAKFSKPYFSEEEPKVGEFKPILLPGLKLEDSPLGVRYVIFESVPANPGIAKRAPVFVPFLPEGESEGDAASLIPIWPGDEWDEPLHVLSIPYLPYYEKWHGGVTGRIAESAAIPHLTPPNTCQNPGFGVVRSDKGVQVTPSDQDLSPYELAVFIYACVVSEQPTVQHPMTLVIPSGMFSEEYRALLRTDASWKNGTSCEFAFDPMGAKLLKGSVPGFVLSRSPQNRLIVSQEVSAMPVRSEDPLPDWITDALKYIRDKAPATDLEALAWIKSNPEFLRKSIPADAPKERDDMIRMLLALWKHDDSPAALECAWYSGKERVVRALAAVLASQKRKDLAGTHEGEIDLEVECRRFDAWEAALRNEERNHLVAVAIHDALKAWEARIARENPKPEAPNETGHP